ncbi:hypothetical protein AQUCO_00500041v1 [Aquilegia coerulea]|uniref:F-box/LRR-repeat protein 15/At3g58940/PEG3-like LRR domain-containing protein n=1 Tax=Aquilegia coerulea TaxID=218851 RepID=A0A2G5EQE5_AQUCA|nr:hypothetical protein AQUCO_00500041v1 [Aquilegia coerulea]
MEDDEERRKFEVSCKWQDLSTNCLVQIFQKVGLECLILVIPFVCKSWYKASLDPQLYKVLDFQFMNMYGDEEEDEDEDEEEDDSALVERRILPPMQFMKIAVNRSRGMATEVLFPEYHDGVDDSVCPALKTLVLPGFFKMISKLKNLESLTTFNTDWNFRKILNEIHIHCPNFQSLTVRTFLNEDTASAIVTLFPNLKHLEISDGLIVRDTLITILSGCRKLESLNVIKCKGFDADDAMLIKLASHIKVFKFESSGCQLGNLSYTNVSLLYSLAGF